jgi:hypothetical protein
LGYSNWEVNVATSYIISGVILLVFFMMFPLVFQFAIRSRCDGKLLCAITGKDKPLNFKLLKTETAQGKGEFVRDGADQWFIETRMIKLVKYPIMFPKALSMFQQIVPCELVMRGRAEPLNWEDPGVGIMSSKELPVVLDPHWMVALVKGIEEGVAGGSIPKNMKMLLFLAVGASCLCLVMIFVVMYKMGTMQSALQNSINLIH